MENNTYNNVTNTSTTDGSPFKDFYVQARFITGLILYPICCLFGGIGNVISIIVLSKKSSSTTVYLASLSISDLVKILDDVLYFATILTLQVDADIGQKMYTIIYPYTHYLFHAPMCISAWIIVFVAAERFVCVCYPTKAKSYCTIRNAKAITITIAVVLCVLNIPFALRYKTIVQDGVQHHDYYRLEITELWSSGGFETIFTWIKYTIRVIIPLILLIFLNTCIILGLRTCKFKNKKTRTTVTLIIVIIVFIMLSMPDAIMSTVLGFGYHEESYLAKGIREITDFLLLVNSCINFLMYCICNTIFLDNVKGLCCQPNSSDRGVTTQSVPLFHVETQDEHNEQIIQDIIEGTCEPQKCHIVEYIERETVL